MRKRIMKTLAMLGLSVCILVGGAVSGVAEEPARKECKENEHKWKTFVEYREDCVPTDFTLDGKTFTLCPHCGKEGRKDPVQRLTKVKNTFSNFSNLEIYEGSLQDGPKIMTVAFYYQTCMNKVVCTKCGKATDPASKYCGSCGAPIAADARPRCPNKACRKFIPPGGCKFCPACGSRI